ncbi:MAG: hypothetical protein ACE5GE_14015, partial [Phycisphaerae bacterium]
SILDGVPDTVEVWALADFTGGQLPSPLQGLAKTGRFQGVQMYGQVTGNTLTSLSELGLQTVAVRHVADASFVEQTDEWLDQVSPARPDLILLDAAATDQLGGTGQSLNWQLIADRRQAGCFDDWPPLVLAGGLTSKNVANAIRLVRPAWVDVASGVEQRPGTKDPAKVRAFLEAAKSVEL